MANMGGAPAANGTVTNTAGPAGMAMMQAQAQKIQLVQSLMQINATLQAHPSWQQMTHLQKYEYLKQSGYLPYFQMAEMLPYGMTSLTEQPNMALVQRGIKAEGGDTGDESGAKRGRGRPKRKKGSESSDDEPRRGRRHKSRRHAAGMSDSEASDASDSDLSDVVSDEEGKIKRQARWAYNSLKEPGLSGSDDEERKPSRRTRAVPGKLQAVEDDADKGPMALYYLKPVTMDLVKGPNYDPANWEWRCHICGDDQTTDDNVILLCDGCNVPVHQECYGVQTVPDGDWFCDGCTQGMDPNKPNCAVCPHTGGALRKVTDFGKCFWHNPDEMHPAEKKAQEEAEAREAERKAAAAAGRATGTQSEVTSGAEGSGPDNAPAGSGQLTMKGLPQMSMNPGAWPTIKPFGGPAISGSSTQEGSVPEAAQPKKKGRKKGSGKKKGMDSSDAAKKLERMPKIYEEFAHLMPPKDTRKKTHVHMCCALFVTDITFNNPDAMSDLSLSQMTPARMDLKCVVCGQAGGGTMQCAVGNCYKGFHVLCGRARSFTMGFRATDGHPLGFCREHSGPRYRRVRESMLNGRKLMAAEVEDMAEEEKDEEPPVIASAPRTITEAEQARVAQIERNKAMMEKMFDL